MMWMDGTSMSQLPKSLKWNPILCIDRTRMPSRMQTSYPQSHHRQEAPTEGKALVLGARVMADLTHEMQTQLRSRRLIAISKFDSLSGVIWMSFDL
jgi:hypothetical protein